MTILRITRVYLYCIASLAVLLACTDSKRSSTEVENELQVASISGIAATGFAMQSASWEVYSPTGKILASGTTDSIGAFEGFADSLEDSDVQPWLVRVADATDTITALFSADTTIGNRDSLFGLVNPMTDFVARRALGSAVNAPRAGFAPPSKVATDSLGNRAVKAIFGSALTWNEFSRDRDYKPALLAQDSNWEPSPNDALLHSLVTNAKRRGISVEHLLDTLYLDDRFQILGDSTYQLDLATAMANLGIRPEQAEQHLDAWRPAGEPEDTAVLNLYLQTRSGDDFIPYFEDTSRGVNEGAIAFLIQSYSGPAQDSVRRASNEIAQLLTQLAPPPQAGAGPNEQERDQMLVRELTRMIAELDAYLWTSHFQETQVLVHSYFSEVLIARSPEQGPVSVEMIRNWIDNKWNKPRVLNFKVNPLRAPQDNNPLHIEPKQDAVGYGPPK
jgi:hypothetical protein